MDRRATVTTPTAPLARQFATRPLSDEFWAGEVDDISRAYRDLPVRDDSVVALWAELGAHCRAMADLLKQSYEITVYDDLDPYATSDEMHADIDRGVYKVTSLYSNHPVWDVDTNVAFRITHDLTGHGLTRSDFSFAGEVEAYRNQCMSTPQHLWPVLFTEVVAQSAYANVHHLFGEQKVALIPLTQAEIDEHVGRIMDTADPAYDATHRSASSQSLWNKVADAIRANQHRRCESCGAAMRNRTHRQRDTRGRLLCEECINMPNPDWAHHSSLTPAQQQEYTKRAAEALRSILRVTAKTAITWDTYGVKYADGTPASVNDVVQVPGIAEQCHVTQMDTSRPTVVWVQPHSQWVRDWEEGDPLPRMVNVADVTPVETVYQHFKHRPGPPSLGSRKVAHDSGDGALINHCPFCGSGAVTGRSDGSVDCGFCHTVYTVQVQPSHPNMPQTIDGQPTPPPGMPAGQDTEMSAPVDPAVDQNSDGSVADGLGQAKADPTEQAGGHDPSADQDPAKKGNPFPPKKDAPKQPGNGPAKPDDGGDKKKNLPPWLKKKQSSEYTPTIDCWHCHGTGEEYNGEACEVCGGSGVVDAPRQYATSALSATARFFTAEGEVLDAERYLRRLALDHADDRMSVLAKIREENS